MEDILTTDYVIYDLQYGNNYPENMRVTVVSKPFENITGTTKNHVIVHNTTIYRQANLNS